MPNANKVILMGNLTRDPELRYTPKGTAIADIGLAINRQYKDGDGNKKEETTFVDVTLWGRTAEIAGQYCQKGRPLYVEGRLQLDTWDDKQTGQKRSKLKVVGDNIQLIGSKPESNGQPKEDSEADIDSRFEQTTQKQSSQKSFDDEFSGDDDDIPF